MRAPSGPVSKACGRAFSNGLPRPVRVLAALFFCLMTHGCSRDERPDASVDGRILPPVLRYASDPSRVGGRSGLSTLLQAKKDLSAVKGAVLLDDPFTDLTPWRSVGREDEPNRAFRLVTLSDAVGERALEVRSGVTARGRLLPLSSKKDLTVWARLVLPEGCGVETVKDGLFVAELKRVKGLTLKAVSPAMSLAVHSDWKFAGRHGRWTDCFLTFYPRTDAGFLVVTFDTFGPKWKGKGRILVDRLVIRSAVLSEVAASLVGGGSLYSGTVPMVRHDAGGELRQAFVTADEGRLALEAGPGGARVLRFGLTFPAAG